MLDQQDREFIVQSLGYVLDVLEKKGKTIQLSALQQIEEIVRKTKEMVQPWTDLTLLWDSTNSKLNEVKQEITQDSNLKAAFEKIALLRISGSHSAKEIASVLSSLKKDYSGIDGYDRLYEQEYAALKVLSEQEMKGWGIV